MIKRLSRDYNETMQEMLLELKLSTVKFLKKFKEKSKDKKIDPIKIPITLSLKGDYSELEKNLFGIGDKIKNPELSSLKDSRLINDTSTITNGVILSHGKIIFFTEEYRLKPDFKNYNYFLTISENALRIGVNVSLIVDWLFEKISKYDCTIIIEGKEITTRDELETILNVLIQNTSF